MLKAFTATTQDMSILLDDELSENQGITPEGYLICKNVPVSRVGVQYYLGSELGLQDAWNKKIPVYRLAEDVFHEEALRSLESKPITDDHPQNPVNVQNASYLSMGHGRNVRFSDKHVMADLVITNAGLIQAVRDKRKFEISLGYTCKYLPYKDGYRQTDIRVNHIAVVENGRAGRKVCIKDKALIENNRRSKPMNKQQAFAALLTAYAKDASPEDVAAILPFVTDAEPVKVTDSDKTDKGVLALLTGILSRDSKEAKTEKTEALTADAIAKIVQDEIAKALKPLKTAKATKDESEKELKAMLEDEDPDKDDDEKEAKDKDDDEDEQEKEAKDSDFAKILAAVKPAYKKLPKAEQKQMRDTLEQVRKKPTADAYAKILGIVQANRKTHDAQNMNVVDSSQLARKVMQERNPHYKKA